MLPNHAAQLVADHDTNRAGSFIGPLPPPSLLASYEAVKPGLADRIVRMAEVQAAHRQGMESRLIGAKVFASSAGMFCGLTIALAVLAAAAWIAGHGAPWPGAVLGVGDLSALVAVFVTGQRARTAKASPKALPQGETPARSLPQKAEPEPEPAPSSEPERMPRM
jgi:uncharacterized membrane protein